jgi:hypothetical protein
MGLTVPYHKNTTWGKISTKGLKIGYSEHKCIERRIILKKNHSYGIKFWEYEHS